MPKLDSLPSLLLNCGPQIFDPKNNLRYTGYS
jgi:hypothetical protein